MENNAVPKVFLSHAHHDKSVARRLVRRLTAHGIKVWIDEREMKIGDILTTSLRTHIEDSDLLLVIASSVSASSRWVGLELDYARDQGKSVIPFFIEPLDTHSRFHDFLGVDATSPQAFEDVVHSLMRNLFLSFDLELPPADPILLEAGLRELAIEEPNLRPLILGCLESEGLHMENIDTACSVTLTALDEALHALFDLMPTSKTASHVALGFYKAGAGKRALSLWIEATGDGEGQLVSALGTQPLDTLLISTAIRLLGECKPPNNYALYQFIHHNSKSFDETQRRDVIRLVTWPVRNDTTKQGDVLGWVALKHFPEAVEIQQMWARWINKGVFDGNPAFPRNLAGYLKDAEKEALSGWDQIHEALRSHVRACLRSGDKNRVDAAISHITACADAGAPVLRALLTEATGVTGTWEWNQWKEHDPDTAELMGWWVFEVVEEANGQKNWSEAWNRAKQISTFEKRRRQM